MKPETPYENLLNENTKRLVVATLCVLILLLCVVGLPQAQPLRDILLHIPEPSRNVLLVLVLPLFVWSLVCLGISWIMLHKNIDASFKAVKELPVVLTSAEIANWAERHKADPLAVLIRAVDRIASRVSPPLQEVLTASRAQIVARSVPSRANVVLLASLVGTIIGLAGMLSTLASPSSGSATSPIAAIAPMATAFASTVYGAIMAATLSLIGQQIALTRARYLALNEQFILNNVAPQVLPASSEALAQQLHDLIDQSRKTIDSLRKASERATDHIAKKMEDSAKSLDASFRESGRFMNQTVAAMQSCVEEFDRCIKQNLDLCVSDFARAVATMTAEQTTLRDLQGTLQSGFASLEAKHRDVVSAVQRVAEVTVQGSGTADVEAKEVRRQVQLAVEALRHVSAELTSIEQSIQGAAGDLQASLISQGDTMARVHSLIERLPVGISREISSIIGMVDRGRSLQDGR